MTRDISAIREKYGSPQVVTLVEGAFIRPNMYTIEGTVFEVAAFLEGYYGAAAKSKGGFEVSSCWYDFNAWLIAEMGNELQGGWHYLYQEVKRLYPQDELAFDYLLEKCLQFQAHENYSRNRAL